MDQPYQAVVVKLAGISAFGQQGEEGLVEIAETAAAHLEQLLEEIHKILPDRTPAGAQEFGSEPVRSGCLSCGQALNCIPNLVHAEGGVEVSQVTGIDELRQVQRVVVLDGGAKKRVKVQECRFRHLLVLGEHVSISGEAEHTFFLLVEGALPVEESCVSVAVLEVGDASTLL